MSTIIIGTTTCSFCTAAKQEANKHNIPYESLVINRGEKEEELNAIGKPITMEEAVSLVGRPFRTVPQIIVNGEYIGGYEDFINYIARKNLDTSEFDDMDL
jgi:glutaredoxin 3